MRVKRKARGGGGFPTVHYNFKLELGSQINDCELALSINLP